MNLAYSNYFINKILFIMVTFIIFCCRGEEKGKKGLKPLGVTSLGLGNVSLLPSGRRASAFGIRDGKDKEPWAAQLSSRLPRSFWHKYMISRTPTLLSSLTTSPINACSACSQPPPTVLQPKDSGAKCTNAMILESFTAANKFDKTKCKHYVQCNKTASIVAHYTDKGESSCLTGLARMDYMCINSTWMAEFRGDYYPGVDQLYCYESDENLCSKCPESLQPLQPGNKTKCDDDDQTITSSKLVNVTDDSSVCTWQVVCSVLSSGTWINLNDTNDCMLYGYNLSPTYMCLNGKWTVLSCDAEPCQLFSYHEIDEIYCVESKTTTALTTKGTTKISHSSTYSTHKTSIPQTSAKPITTSLKTKTGNKKIIIYAIVIASVIALLVVISIIVICIYISYRRKRETLKFFRTKASGNNYRLSDAAVLDDPWMINSDKLEIHRQTLIGHGTFSEVYIGFLYGDIPIFKIIKNLNTQLHSKTSELTTKAAVKCMLEYATENELNNFREEVEIMKLLEYHSNVVCMYGYSLSENLPRIILEYCQIGDLKGYLSKINPDEIEDEREVSKEFVSFSWQISNGMCYISSKNIIHRDLAARNVLLTSEKVAKVSDFGMSIKSNEEENQDKSYQRLLPIRWSAPETFGLKSFSEKSDVWSFGVTIWEIFSFGEMPYKGIESAELQRFLIGGNRLEKPKLCEEQLYLLMNNCWCDDLNDRPSFECLKAEISNHILKNNHYYGYVDLQHIQTNSTNLSKLQ